MTESYCEQIQPLQGPSKLNDVCDHWGMAFRALLCFVRISRVPS